MPVLQRQYQYRQQPLSGGGWQRRDEEMPPQYFDSENDEDPVWDMGTGTPGAPHYVAGSTPRLLTGKTVSHVTVAPLTERFIRLQPSDIMLCQTVLVEPIPGGR